MKPIQLFNLLLKDFCKGKYELITEFRFAKPRRWRSDFYIKELNALIEMEGINSVKSRHTSITGYTNDCEKYRSASIAGFIILRYTVLDYTKVIDDLKKIEDANKAM